MIVGFIMSSAGRGQTPKANIGYTCDTEPGSSGSPVLSAVNHTMIALHHLGGCNNHGTYMRDIYPEIKSIITKKSMSMVSFQITGLDWTSPGEDAYLVGNIPELGDWDPYQGVKLSGESFPVWKGEVELPEGVDVEFKVVVIDNRNGPNGYVTWETGENRTLSGARPSSSAYSGEWRK